MHTHSNEDTSFSPLLICAYVHNTNRVIMRSTYRVPHFSSRFPQKKNALGASLSFDRHRLRQHGKTLHVFSTHPLSADVLPPKACRSRFDEEPRKLLSPRSWKDSKILPPPSLVYVSCFDNFPRREQILGKSLRFLAEDEIIAGTEGCLRVRPRGLCGKEIK